MDTNGDDGSLIRRQLSRGGVQVRHGESVSPARKNFFGLYRYGRGGGVGRGRGVGVARGPAVAVGVGVAVAVAVAVGVGVGVSVGVGVGLPPGSMSVFVYRSNACNVPSGFVPSQFVLSAHTV